MLTPQQIPTENIPDPSTSSQDPEKSQQTEAIVTETTEGTVLNAQVGSVG